MAPTKIRSSPRTFLTPRDNGDDSSGDEMGLNTRRTQMMSSVPTEEDGEESPGPDEIFTNISSKMFEITLSLEPGPEAQPQSQWELGPEPDMDVDWNTDATECIISRAGPVFGSLPTIRTPLRDEDLTHSDSTLPSEKETGKTKSIAPLSSPPAHVDTENEEEKAWSDPEYNALYYGEEVGMGQEAENHESDEEDVPNDWDNFRWFFMDPITLHGCSTALKSLGHKQWLESDIIDLWLLAQWKTTSRRQRNFLYIPTTILQTLNHGDTTPEEIGSFRSFFNMPRDPLVALPYQDIVCVLNGGIGSAEDRNHFYVVAFMPNRKMIWVLGKDYTRNASTADSDDWDSWNGRTIWRRICALMGWEVEAEPLFPMTLFSVDWKQNGFDCGPTACHLVHYLIQNGLSMGVENHWTRPTLHCYHPVRKIMWEGIRQLINDGCRNFVGAGDFPLRYYNRDDNQAASRIDLLVEVEAEMGRKGPGSGWRAFRGLEVEMERCRACHEMAEDVLERRRKSQPDGSFRLPIMAAKDRRKREAGKGTVSVSGYVFQDPKGNEGNVSPHPECDADNDDPGDEMVPSGEEEGEEVAPGSPKEAPVRDKPIKNGHGATVVGDWTQADIGRFPRPAKGPELSKATKLRGLIHPFQEDFDHYLDGPTLDILAPVHETVNHFDASLVWLAGQVTIDPWNLFKDYGFRLLPDFAQNFYLGEPKLVQQHLCPVGLRYPPTSITEYHHKEDQGRLGDEMVVMDDVVMGLRELMKEADKYGDEVLLSGKDHHGRYIVLDLQKDRVQPEKLKFSCDIDSVIWITRKPQFSGPCSVFSGPNIRSKAPIWKHNHVTVDLLYPQSMEDQEEGGYRREWFAKSSPLSNIPHLSFATIQGVTPVDVILFFPRMKHRDPHRRFWRNQVPSDIQGQLWDKVVLPALGRIIPKGMASLYPKNREQASFKQGKKTNASQLALQPEHWKGLISEMNRVIEDEKNNLDFFGSFFFVIEIKGCKRLTHTEGDVVGNSLENSKFKLEASYNQLDWEYMKCRGNGELILDMGISVYPDDTREQLVGLWRLDCLEASYGAAGYRKGIIHTINTLSMYGALQAESPPWRRQQTHMSFRSSYPQAYEAIRQHDNSRNLFNEKDVYNRTQTFLHDVNSVKKIYDDTACNTSYGVRDEFRIGYDALEPMVQCIEESVTDFQKSRPVLWIPSRFWFAFLSRRLGILQATHRQICQKQPPNYGILSGLFAYLMQSVIFTPPLVNTYVRESLGLLRYKQNCARFGMFFLDSLDLNTATIIPEIVCRDDALVYRVLGECSQKARVAMVSREDKGDLEIYPLGEMPSWHQVKASIQSNPTILMEEWGGIPESLRMYVEASEDSLQGRAAKLFVDFTNHLWIVLNPANRLDPEDAINFGSLEEALKAWTVDSVLSHCAKPNFEACNTGIFDNVPGRPALTFGKRRKIYFPKEAGIHLRKKTYWGRFMVEPGYIRSYWAIRDGLPERQHQTLDRFLEQLLDACQCLPDSSRGDSGNRVWHVRSSRVTILTNPRHYSLKGIGRQDNHIQSESIRSKRGAPAHTNREDTITQMLIQKGHPPLASLRAYRWREKEDKRKINEKRTGKSKNKRDPPQRNRGQKKSETEPRIDSDTGEKCDKDHSVEGDETEPQCSTEDDESDHQGEEDKVIFDDIENQEGYYFHSDEDR